MTIALINEADIRNAARAVVNKVTAEVLEILPHAQVEEIGSTAIAGSLTKGDIDLLVLVDEDKFGNSETLLTAQFAINEMDLLAYFQSYTLCRDGFDVGLQLTIANEANFKFVAFRNCLRSNPELVEQYNQIKLNAQHCTMDDYRLAKHQFIEAVLNNTAYFPAS